MDYLFSVFSYLFNLVPDCTDPECLESRYWGELPDAIEQNSISTNWLHLYVKGEWRESMTGKSAVNNLLYLGLFESTMACLPRQQCDIYLLENQAWESGMICSWQTAGHGQLIGS